MAKTLSVLLSFTTHTSPKAPLPITFTTSKSSRDRRRVFTRCTTGLTATRGTALKQRDWGSSLKTGQHFIFVIIYQLLPIKCIIFDSVSKILFIFFLLPIIIMILIMKILLHNEYKIINLRYPTYVYPFLIFLVITKIECWPVFKQDPRDGIKAKGLTSNGMLKALLNVKSSTPTHCIST